jgi:predicted nucleic acid-binding protein
VTLYLDSSALVKRYAAEEGSDAIVRAMDLAEAWSSCRLAFVETVRAVGLRAGARSTGRVRLHRAAREQGLRTLPATLN